MRCSDGLRARAYSTCARCLLSRSDLKIAQAHETYVRNEATSAVRVGIHSTHSQAAEAYNSTAKKLNGPEK